MIETPIIAAIAIPRAATATPVRLSDAAISPKASRATGLARPNAAAADLASERNTAGVSAATLSSSRNSDAKPANRLREEAKTMMPAATASAALANSSLRAMPTAFSSSAERRNPN